MPAKYYVSPTGNDDNPGTIDKPFKSIQNAIDSTAGEARQIYLRGGDYDVTEGAYQTDRGPSGIYITEWNGGSKDTPLTIEAYENEKPVLDGSKVGNGIISMMLKDVENVDIIGLELHSGKSHGIEVVNGKNINILNNVSRDNQGEGIGVRGYISNVEGNGDTANRSENIRVEGNTVYHNMLDNSGENKGKNNWGGALFIRHAANTVVANNTVYENYGEGIIILQSTDASVEKIRCMITLASISI